MARLFLAGPMAARHHRAMTKRRCESPELFDIAAAGPDDVLERRLARRFGDPVAGVDEAGRGPLAGPVVAAAVILDPADVPTGLNDSKKLTEATRERLFAEICKRATVAVGIASVDRIDAMNILQANLWAMAQALGGLALRPAAALIDGRDVPPTIPCPGEAVIKGDARSLSIAAASIIAKVTRDRLMIRLAHAYPGYGFERHKGYGTRAHKAALASLGPSPLHRKSFEPIRSLLKD